MEAAPATDALIWFYTKLNGGKIITKLNNSIQYFLRLKSTMDMVNNIVET